MNGSATLLFPNTANGSMQPDGISTQILLLQILHLVSQTQNTLMQQHLNLLKHSQEEFDDIKKRMKEPTCETKTRFDQFQQTLQIRLDICDTNNTFNIKKQTTDLQVLNNKVLELQQQLENKTIQHENISSELLECKTKSNTDCLEKQTKQLKSIQTQFEICEQEKETMENEHKKQLKVLAGEAENILKNQALNKAVSENNLEKVKILLEAGVNTETVENNGYTPLHNASKEGNLEIVKVLVQYGANLFASSEDQFGDKPIHVAAETGKEEVLQFLLDKGVPVDIRNKYGTTPLGIAAWHGTYDAAKFLIQKGADVNDHLTNLDWRTPLHSAAYQGHIKLVELLLDHGADINALEADNETALHWAAKRRRLEVAKLLVKRGINANLQNRSGKTAKQTATEYNSTDVANYLASI